MPPEAALTVAEYARAHVPLYQALYRGLPAPLTAAAFGGLPPLTAERLRATPLAQQVDALADTLRGVTPFSPATLQAPAAQVTDADDSDTFYTEARVAAGLLGLTRGSTLALIAPPTQRYFAAELSDRLGYAGIRADLIIDHGAATTGAALTALEPDRSLSVGPAAAVSVRPDITIRDPRHDGADLWVVPQAGIVAVRAAGRPDYRILHRFFHVETGHGGRLLVTALLRYHQPVIRLLTDDRGRLARGRLHLTAVAP